MNWSKAVLAATVAIAGTALSCGTVAAQIVKENIPAKLNLDLAVPEAPAFTVLDLTPQTVSRPTTPNEFATSLLNGIDPRGNFQTGLALEANPYLLYFGDMLTVDEYRKGVVSLRRLAARTLLSAATAKGANGDDKALRLALGLRTTLWDNGDPRFDDALKNCFEGLPEPPSVDPLLTQAQKDDAIERYKTSLTPLVKKCKDDSAKRLWNRSNWGFGGAPSWISKDGSTDKIKWNGGGVWTSLAYGFEQVALLHDRAQFIVHIRYRADEQVPDAKMKNVFFKQDSVLVGGRFIVGWEKFAVSLESALVHAEPVGHKTDDALRMSIAADLRISEGVWLELAIGGEGGKKDGNNQAFVLGSLKWGLSTEPAIKLK